MQTATAATVLLLTTMEAAIRDATLEKVPDVVRSRFR